MKPGGPTALRDLVALRLVSGLPRRQLNLLWERLGGTQGILNAPASRLGQAAGLSPEQVRSVAGARENPAIDEELELMAELSATLIERGGPDYPPLLALAPSPPPLLYRRGAASPDDAHAVAIVGSRRITQYGRLTARSLARGLALSGIVIVSGFAHGIDTEAMLGAARAGGRAVGVLGCGLAISYPAGNERYVDELLESGALFSEYPMKTQPARHLFPERNSIIAGMTLGTVVVEAQAKSGSLITADAALEAGRTVFAVPGDITRETSRGANRLIQAGAKLVMDANDILVELSSHLRALLREREEAEVEGRREARAKGASMEEADLFEEEPTPEPDRPSSARADRREARDVSHPDERSPLARLIVELLAAEPLQLDDLLQARSLREADRNAVADALLDLELDGAIQELPGKIYVLKEGRLA